MSSNSNDKVDQILSEARRNQISRKNTYRERALKMYPHICGRCSREFSGKRLQELTVHHRDHNHDNNPPDGSNWELLCTYCHDDEHSREKVANAYDDNASSQTSKKDHDNKPFAGLADLLKGKGK